MFKFLISTILVLLCLNVEAETLYVYSKALCTAVGCGATDGTSKANAFNGTADIVWGSGAGQVGPGDTLCAYGTYTGIGEVTSGTGTNAMMFRINNSGSDAANLITIDGDCDAVGESGYAVLDGNSEVGQGFRAAVSGLAQSKFIKVRRFKLKNFTSRAVMGYNTGGVGEVDVDSNQTWEYLIITDIAGNQCVDLRGNYVEFSRSTVSGCADDGIYVKGTNFTLADVTVSRVSTGGTTGDGLAMDTYANNYNIRRFTCDHTNNDYKQCIIIGTLTDTGLNGVIEDANLNCYPGGTTMLCLSFTGTNAVARRVYTRGGNYGIAFADEAATNGTRLESSIALDATTQGIAVFGTTPTGVQIFNSVAARAGGNGISISPMNTTTITNSVALSNGGCGINKQSGTTESYNDSFGNATNYCSNGSGTSAGTGSLTLAPKFVGGSAPTTNIGFRLSGGSPLRRVGAELGPGNVLDNGGRAFSHPPSIGAWEAASGDSITNNTRTTASARTSRQ